MALEGVRPCVERDRRDRDIYLEAREPEHVREVSLPWVIVPLRHELTEVDPFETRNLVVPQQLTQHAGRPAEEERSRKVDMKNTPLRVRLDEREGSASSI